MATALITLARAGGPPGAGDQPRRGQAQAGARDRRPRRLRVRARLPVKVDAVMETVGARPGRTRSGRCAPAARSSLSGTTSGPERRRRRADPDLLPPAAVIGSTMGTRAELASLIDMLDATGTRPLIDRALPMDEARDGLRRDGRRRRLRQDRLHPMTRPTWSPAPARASVPRSPSGCCDRGDRLVAAGRASDERADELRAEFAGAEPGRRRPGGPLRGGRRWPRRLPERLDSLVHAAGRRRRSARSPTVDVDAWREPAAVNLVAPARADPGRAAGAARGPRHGGASSTPAPG